jgi:biotin carboxylase
MKRVLLFSHTTGYQLRSFNDAADALGIEIVFATDRCHKLDDPWQDRAIPVRFRDLDPSVDLIVSRARERSIDGVIAVGDHPVVLAARAAAALGLRWHSVAGAEASTDKRHSRAALAIAGFPSPRFTVKGLRLTADAPGAASVDRLSGPGELGPDFPVVLKPVGLSGSRGVIRANNPAEFASAFARISALLSRPQVRAARAGGDDEILVEQYIDGKEFALEGVLTGGTLRVLALFDKPDPLVGPFFEETIYVTPSRAPGDLQERISATVQKAAHALRLSHGPLHAECRVSAAGEVYVLEVAARPIGGLCSRVLAFGESGRVTLETVLLEHAIGRSLEGYEREAAAAAVMMIPIPRSGIFKGMSGVEAAAMVPGVNDIRITAKEGQLLEPLPESGSYLGFIFARGASPADAEHSVRQAHAALQPVIGTPLLLTAR